LGQSSLSAWRKLFTWDVCFLCLAFLDCSGSHWSWVFVTYCKLHWLDCDPLASPSSFPCSSFSTSSF
jgi:hypothetical protein